ncbi:chromodomain-helicase-DNA-binding protein 1 isoform X2 [Calliphora vicina]|uniref:chromodomain-helicase-DNA-binding protein 1 isoform X2 n=2 Tax=Calliphora vicina TaxID=7373 RepID=UPI00325AA7BD
MVGKIHKKKISEYTEAAENEDKQSERGDEAEDEMILDHVDPAPSGSDSENGDIANNDNNKTFDSLNANDDDDVGADDAVGTGLNDDDTDFHLSDGGDDGIDEDKVKKAKKRKAIGSKKSGDNESDDEPLNGTPKKKGRKLATGKAKGAKGKAKAKKPVSDDEDDGDVEEEYEVKDIVGHKTERGVSYFLIRWKGYTKDDDTWEAEDTLSCPDIIEKYKKKQKSSPKKDSSPAKKKGGKAAGGGRGSKKNKDDEEEQEWEVEKIIDYAEEKKGRVFRIRWKGFGPKNDTWEPEENLNCGDIIQKFLAKMKLQENVSFKELREEPKKTKRLVNETAPRTNINNPIGRKSKRSVTKKRVFYGDMED